jgi:hypothetical protein
MLSVIEILCVEILLMQLLLNRMDDFALTSRDEQF